MLAHVIRIGGLRRQTTGRPLTHVIRRGKWSATRPPQALAARSRSSQSWRGLKDVGASRPTDRYFPPSSPGEPLSLYPALSQQGTKRGHPEPLAGHAVTGIVPLPSDTLDGLSALRWHGKSMKEVSRRVVRNRNNVHGPSWNLRAAESFERVGSCGISLCVILVWHDPGPGLCPSC